MKREYNIVVDVMTTYRTSVVAENKQDAMSKAEEYAYQDTMGSSSTWAGCKVHDAKIVDSWTDMNNDELIESIKQITGTDHPNHLMNHLIKSERIYQESK